MNKLKPCAHCKHFAVDAGQIDKQGTFEICCSYCGSMMRGMDHAQLVEDWNRRSAPESPPLDAIELAEIALALQHLKAENTALKAKLKLM